MGGSLPFLFEFAICNHLTYAHSCCHFMHQIVTPLQAIGSPFWSTSNAVLASMCAAGTNPVSKLRCRGARRRRRERPSARRWRCARRPLWRSSSGGVRLVPLKSSAQCYLLGRKARCLLTQSGLIPQACGVSRALPAASGHKLFIVVLRCTWLAPVVLTPKPGLQPAGEPAAAFARGCRSRPAGSSGGTPPSLPTATSRLFSD